MASFEISIITPEGATYIGQCDQAILPGSEGVFGVLANHMNMISLLKAGVVIVEDNFNDNQAFKKYVISSGIAEVSNNRLSIKSEALIRDLNNQKAYLEAALQV
jgi:F-type H+-transporting ATPase subunit epsilon